jgi:hypothetical protein
MSALTQLIRKINAKRNAERASSQRCVVVVVATKRERGLSEANTHVYKPADVCSCIHSVSYTMPCKHCRRDKRSSEINLAKLKAKLSIT